MRDIATMTISGTVVADPQVSGLADNPDRVMIRVISNKRWRDNSSGEWIDGEPYAVNVVCWRKLARGVANTVRKGDPVIVIGQMSERSYTPEGGEKRWRSELVAEFVSPDLRFGIAGKFTRFTRLDKLNTASTTGSSPGDADGATSATSDQDNSLAITGESDSGSDSGNSEFDGEPNSIFEPAENNLAGV